MSPIDTHHALHTQMLGAPLHEERTCSDGVGRYRTYEGGSIYFHPETGPKEIHGGIRDCWKRLGGESGFLGYPVTDELDYMGNLLLDRTVSDAFFLRHPWGAFSRYTPIYAWLHTPPQFPRGHVHGRCSLFRGGVIIWWNDPEAMRRAGFTVLLRPSDVPPSDLSWMPVRDANEKGFLDKISAKFDASSTAGQVRLREIPTDYSLSIPVADFRLPSGDRWPEYAY